MTRRYVRIRGGLTPQRAAENRRWLKARLLRCPFIADAPAERVDPGGVSLLLRDGGEVRPFASAPIVLGRRVYLFAANEDWEWFCATFAACGARKLFTLEAAEVAP